MRHFYERINRLYAFYNTVRFIARKLLLLTKHAVFLSFASLSGFLKCLYGQVVTVPITKTCLFKYIENFTTKKKKQQTNKQTENFQMKILVVFIFLLKNIDCGYLLEPPLRGGSNEYPQFVFEQK